MVASLARHRVRALTGAALDGLVVGATEAARDHPRHSWARRRVHLALLTAVTTDAVLGEVPALRDVWGGRPHTPVPAEEQRATVGAGLVAAGWGLAVASGGSRLAATLQGRGWTRPHAVIALPAGLLTAVSTLPFWWRRATLRAERDRRAQREARDVAAWEAELAAATRRRDHHEGL